MYDQLAAQPLEGLIFLLDYAYFAVKPRRERKGLNVVRYSTLGRSKPGLKSACTFTSVYGLKGNNNLLPFQMHQKSQLTSRLRHCPNIYTVVLVNKAQPLPSIDFSD